MPSLLSTKARGAGSLEGRVLLRVLKEAIGFVKSFAEVLKNTRIEELV